MQVTCLYFPRLALELAWHKRPALRSRPVVLIDGAGDTALVTARSPEAADCGVLAGMQAGQARRVSWFHFGSIDVTAGRRKFLDWRGRLLQH